MIRNRPTIPGARVRSVTVGLIVCTALTATGANADTRATVDVSVSGKTVTNPYFNSADNSLAAAGTISIDPRITFNNELSSFVLDGHFSLDQYTRYYGTDETVQLGAAVQTRVSERTVLTGGANFTSTRPGTFDVQQIAAASPPDSSQQISPEVPSPDISAVGRGDRLNRYFAHVGLDHVLSPTSTIGFRLSGGYTDAQGMTGQDYTQVDATIDYDRKLTERTSLVSTLEVGAANYSGNAFRDATFVTPLIGVTHALSESAHFTAQVGATVTRLSGAGDHVDFAANLNLCQQFSHSSLCAVASRSSAPTAYEGVSTITAVGVTYSLQPAPRDHLTLGANYGRTDRASSAAANYKSEVYGASAGYTHQFGARTYGFVRPSVTTNRSPSLGSGATRTDVQVQVGFTQRFGASK